MEYQEFNLQNISDSFFRVGFYSAIMLLQKIHLQSEVNSFEEFMEWVDQVETDNHLESEWRDAERLVNDIPVE